MRHLMNAEVKVLAYLSFPEWKSGSYWPIMVEGKFFHKSVVQVFYSYPTYTNFNKSSSIFQGKKSFRMITALINTEAENLGFEKVEYRPRYKPTC